jgi:hypothetical protein
MDPDWRRDVDNGHDPKSPCSALTDALRQRDEALGALADIATSDDMTLAVAKQKAGRVYAALAAQPVEAK